MSNTTLRKQSQRKYPMPKGQKCEICEKRKANQRHHVRPHVDAIQFVCQSCQTAEHVRLGTWGRMRRVTV